MLKAAALLVLGGLLALSAYAQTWTGNGDGISWNDPANWSTNAVPSGVGATIANPAQGLRDANVVMGAGVTATLTTLTLGHDNPAGNASGTLTMEGDASITTAGNTLIGNYGKGWLILKDTASLTHTAANLGGGIRNPSYGSIRISDSASITMTAGNYIGAERVDGAVQMLIENHGSFTMTHANAVFYASYGGTHNTTGVGPSTVTVKDHGVLSIASGTIRLGNSAVATGTLTLQGDAANGRGSAIARAVMAGSGNTYFVFDGGVLKASDSAIANFISGPVNMQAIGEGAFIDSNARDIAIANTVSFVGTSGLTKLGQGKLTLNNALLYTGTTAVNAGSIVLTAADQLAASSAVNLAATGTITAANLSQTLNDLSGAGVANLGTGAATLGGSGVATFSGILTAASITKAGTGTLTLSGSNSIAGDTTISNGVLALGNDGALGASANKIIMSGGALGSAGNATIHYNIEAQGGAAVAFDSSAKITAAGTITGGNGITKAGTGAVLLTGDLSALSGPVSVNQGGLYAGNLAGSVTVADGAAFGGAGTITGNVSYAGAGALQIGFTHNDSGITDSSTLTITGSLGFGGAATLRYDMYSTGVDTLVAGNIGFGGSTTLDLVNIQTGTFTLLKLTSGTFDSSILSSLITTQDGGGVLNIRASATYALSTDATALQLISGKTNHVVTWTGATDANWDSTTANWSGGDTAFLNGDKIDFNLTGAHNIAIMPTGAVASEMAITGDGSYTFTGGRLAVDKNSAGSLGGSFGGDTPNGNFTINTTGTVTLANDDPNHFQNGIDLQQGTLIGSVMTFGDAAIANNGKTVFNQTIDAAYTGTMSGTGILGKTGSAALLVGSNLSGFTGKTELEGGAFVIDAGVAYNSASITGSNASIAIRDNATVTGSISLADSNVAIGDNAGAGSGIAITGNGSILAGENSLIDGNASVQTGGIELGAGSRISGDASISGNGALTLGVSSAIDGAVVADTAAITLNQDSRIGGSVSLGSGNIHIKEGGRIGGSVTSALSSAIYLSSGTLGGTPEITGDVTINGDAAIVIGAGKIGGVLQTSATTTAFIGVGLTSEVSGSTVLQYAPVSLEIGSIVLGGAAELRGSGTLATASIAFGDTLTINNASTGSDAFTIIGPLSGAGSVVKTGSNTVILASPSAYAGPTGVLEGTLSAGAEGAFAPHSDFTVAPGANLDLHGYSQTLASLVNNGRVYVGANNTPVAGAKLKITGAYTAGTGAGISINIVAADHAKTLSDQVVFTNAANITGTSQLYIQFTDNRADKTRVLYDMDALIIAETGSLAPGSFKLDDGRGYERVILSQRDYIINHTGDGVELVATTAAEMPAALAVNAVSIFANRAALGSLTQRLDYLRNADALPSGDKTELQIWGQGYYRSDKLDKKEFPNSDGTTSGFQVGIDKRSDKAGKAYTTYGAFMDHTSSEADLTMKTSTELATTGLGGYISVHTANDWHTDFVARYSWDKYKINVGHQAMEPGGYTWAGMVRTARNWNLGGNWTLTPQAQLIYQNRDVENVTDSEGREYVFGPATMRLNAPASFEGRVGLGLRKLIAISETVAVAPYISAHLLYEFKGALTVTSVNNTSVSTDFGKDSYLINAGIPMRLGKRIDVYFEGSMQTGGPVDGYGINLGMNYRW